MKISILLILFLMAGVNVAPGKDLALDRTGDNGKDKPEFAAHLIPDSLKVKANDVVRLLEIRVEMEDLSEYSYREHGVVTILSDKSHQNHLGIHYRSTKKITDFTVEVYDANGKYIRKLKKEEIMDMSAISSFSIYEDSRYQLAQVENPEYPYTIEYSYEWEEEEFSSLPPAGFQPSHHSGLEKAVYSVTVSPEIDLKYKISEDVEYARNTVDGMVVYSFSSENLVPHINKINSQYAEDEGYPLVLVQPERFKVAGFTGENTDWTEWGKFFYQLNEGRAEISDDLAAIVHNLKESSQSKRELISNIYRHLQDNTRYVSVQLGIGGYQTFPASYVEKNQFGDCKALSNFMKGMLAEAGVESHLTITHGSRGKQFFHDDFPSPYYFNHMILYVPEEDMFLECTSTDYPAGYMGAGNHGKHAVLLTEDGGKLVEVPVPEPGENLTEYHTKIMLESDGNATVEHTEKGHNEQHEMYRALTSVPVSDVKKYVQHNSSLPAFDYEQFKVEASEGEPLGWINFTAKVNKLAAKAGPRIFVPVNPVSPFKTPYTEKESKFRVERKSGYSTMHTIIYELPDGYEIESIPEFRTLDHEKFGHFKYSYTAKDGQVIFTREMLRLPFDIGPDQYEELREFFKEVEKEDGQKFVLVAGRP